MNITIEIPEERADRFRKQAETMGLSIDQWLLRLAEQNAPEDRADSRSFLEVCALVRGLADDLDLTRDSSPGRDVAL